MAGGAKRALAFSYDPFVFAGMRGVTECAIFLLKRGMDYLPPKGSLPPLMARETDGFALPAEFKGAFFLWRKVATIALPGFHGRVGEGPHQGLLW